MNLNIKLLTLATIIGLILVVPMMFFSCEEDLAEMNIDPHASHILSYDAQFLFVQGKAHSAHAKREMGFYGTVIQQLATLGFGTYPGDKYWNDDINLGWMHPGKLMAALIVIITETFNSGKNWDIH